MLAKIADRNCQQAALITIMLLHWQKKKKRKKKPFCFNPDHLLWGLLVMQLHWHLQNENFSAVTSEWGISSKGMGRKKGGC